MIDDGWTNVSDFFFKFFRFFKCIRYSQKVLLHPGSGTDLCWLETSPTRLTPFLFLKLY